MQPVKFYPLTISGIVDETPLARSFRLRPQAGARAAVRLPGLGSS